MKKKKEKDDVPFLGLLTEMTELRMEIIMESTTKELLGFKVCFSPVCKLAKLIKNPDLFPFQNNILAVSDAISKWIDMYSLKPGNEHWDLCLAVVQKCLQKLQEASSEFGEDLGILNFCTEQYVDWMQQIYLRLEHFDVRYLKKSDMPPPDHLQLASEQF
jgi:hypothetical protein